MIDNDRPASNGTILIVDDDLDVLAANARFLRVSGYEVIVSNRASMALAHIKDEDLDAVVTDLRMPEMDGLQLARQARVIKPLIPIVFFSAFGSVPEVVAAMQLGAVDFLEKPVDPEQLLKRLEDICDHDSSEVAVQPRIAFEDGTVPFRQRVRAYEKYLIETSLVENHGRVSEVMKELNINRRTLNEKMSRLGIKRR